MAEILVVANDVVPGMGVPVAAPGLRAWGIAQGLRRHGHRVTVAVDSDSAGRAWPGPLPIPRPPGTLVMSATAIGDLVRTRRPDAVVLTNSNHFSALGGVGETALIYDFFAPKLLELAEHLAPEQRRTAEEGLTRRKLAALARSSAVIVNGEKKVPYVDEWIARAGRTGDLPTAQVPMALDISPGGVPADGEPLHAVVSGYLQPWSRPGAWTTAVRPFLDDGSLRLHLLVGTHWGSRRTGDVFPAEFTALAEHPNVIRHGLLEYADFRRMLAGCHLSIDVFEANPERELAMVTRSMVALAAGVPVLHVPFTETGALVQRYDAGWLVDDGDLDGITAALQEAVKDRQALGDRRAGAERMAAEVMDPVVATRPLHDLLERLA